MKTETVGIQIMEKEEVSAVISVPEKYRTGTGVGIILAHGAGNDMDHPLVVHVSEGLAMSGYLTLRFNFLYRERGRKRPDRQEILETTWKKVYQFLRNHPKYRPKTILAGGKSMGGRVVSQMVAEGVLPVSRLIFLGYPLHPPGRIEKPRSSHLHQINIPMLFVAGTRDSLCNLSALKKILRKLSVPCELEIIDGGDHSFKLPKSVIRDQEDVYQQVLEATLEWLGAEFTKHKAIRIETGKDEF